MNNGNGLKYKRFIVCVAVWLLATQAMAQTNTGTGQLVGQSPPSPFSGSMTLGRTNSLYDLKDGGTYSSWDLALAGAYKISQSLSASIAIEGSEDIKNPEESDLSRVALGLRKKDLLQTTTGSLSLSGSLSLPVSKVQKNASLITSIGTTARFSLNPKLLNPRISTGFSLSLNRNIHTYETAISGGINTKYSSTQSADFSYAFTEKLSFSVSLMHLNTWNYNDTMKELYGHSQELSYSATDSISLAMGHQLGAPGLSVWSADGSSYNFKLLDDRSSFAYGSLTMTF